METEPVNQPTANPTRKLTSATLASAAMAVIGLILKNKAPGWYDPEVMLALMPFAGLLAGYYVRDLPNS